MAKRRIHEVRDIELGLAETTQALGKRLEMLLERARSSEIEGGDLAEPLKARAQRIENAMKLLKMIALDASELETLLELINARPEIET